MKKFFRKHWGKIGLFLGGIFIFPYIFIWGMTAQHMSSNIDEQLLDSNVSVAIVLGAAVYGNNRVSDVFSDRLKVGAELLQARKVSTILISGDNREVNYNEPEQGKKFLISLGIKEEDIVLDYAGRRTYDTCWRAKNIFGIDSAYIVTQDFHLPRSVFTCERMGIDSYGVSASLQSYKSAAKNFFRESLAQQKAFYEVLFFSHEAAITGDLEPIF